MIRWPAASVLAYAGKSTFEDGKIITTVDMSASEVFSGDKARQVPFYDVTGDKLVIRTPEMASSRPARDENGGVLEWARD